MSETGIETTDQYRNPREREKQVEAGVFFLCVQALVYLAAIAVTLADVFIWRP